MRDVMMNDEKRMAVQAEKLKDWQETKGRYHVHAALVIQNTINKHRLPYSGERSSFPVLESDPFRLARIASHLRNGVTSPSEYV